MSNNFHRNHIKENDIIKEIILKYDDILNNKNIINEDLNLVKLNSTNYSNLKYDMDGTKNDYVNKPLLDDINAAAKSVGVVATITTAKTGHNRLTKGSKNVSRHMDGTGVDVAILDGIGSGKATNSTNGLAKFRNLGFKLKDALVSMGYIWNTESGNDKAVLWHTNTGGNHYNHLHISNKTGESSSSPTKDENPDDETSDQTNLKIDLKGLSGWKSLFGFTDEPTTVGSSEEDQSQSSDDTSNTITSINDYKITNPSSSDNNFYSEVFKKIGAPNTPQNLLFFYAWRQAEGAKSTFNPFNTTHKKEGSTFWNCLKRKEGKCLGGVRNYKSESDGIDATAKTITNGNYDCIVSGLKKDIGAINIATKCPSELKKWGTGEGIKRVLTTKNIAPPPISTSKVKEINEELIQEIYDIKDIIKKVL
jgi:hypothetical protein